MVTAARPHIIIVGAGFGGLEAARALARAPADVTVIDRHNYHLFQPLLYQVATAALSPADIAEPVRAVLRHQQNVTVLHPGDETGQLDPPEIGDRRMTADRSERALVAIMKRQLRGLAAHAAGEQRADVAALLFADRRKTGQRLAIARGHKSGVAYDEDIRVPGY